MKIALAIIIAVLIIGGGYFLLAHTTQAPVTNPVLEGSGTSAPLETTNPNPPADTQVSAAASVSVTPPASFATVTYTDNGFSPKTLNVAVGTTVKFVNNSSHSMWVASGVHPTHTAYDGTTLQQHCEGTSSTSFDECTAVGAGNTYSFTFSKAGSFNYHNHVRANDFGTIVVK
jgi:plastocyanin